ncbi:MFS transporter [Flammeovirga agarivorans]|uniref:MFS transporter n=1 Tax=Flammeovirga agarivorans TaxID=2726742 RepID=A0A7X8SQ65_9BACT|nr:MFS transporter [Flammeovirga agarivorans]NLR94347.1 MFS transporter [Flammeovirga agarivorans]
MNYKKYILHIIVIAQFLCTSLWFASNAVMPELINSFSLENNVLSYLTSSVQLGFIIGTLVFALLSIADRFSPVQVFFACGVLGAVFNGGMTWAGNTLETLVVLRFLTGFFLAGIYPVGMKIAADYYKQGLGKSLGFLVGALVLGTALPHLLKGAKGDLPWEFVIMTTSLLAVIGGGSMYFFVGDGPYRTPSQKLQLSAISQVFKNKEFRKSAFGYFGHMWELYTFWALVPAMLQTYNLMHPQVTINIPVYSFLVIGIGSLACILSGYLSLRFKVRKVALLALLFSGFCCLISPMMFTVGSFPTFFLFLLFWGMTVIADSPLFSTIVAQTAPPALKGTALTIVNCIGFLITIISIQCIQYLSENTDSMQYLIGLVIGPVLGLIALIDRSEEVQTNRINKSGKSTITGN